jgi:hypothetical protein
VSWVLLSSAFPILVFEIDYQTKLCFKLWA